MLTLFHGQFYKIPGCNSDFVTIKYSNKIINFLPNSEIHIDYGVSNFTIIYKKITKIEKNLGILNFKEVKRLNNSFFNNVFAYEYDIVKVEKVYVVYAVEIKKEQFDKVLELHVKFNIEVNFGINNCKFKIIESVNGINNIVTYKIQIFEKYEEFLEYEFYNENLIYRIKSCIKLK